MHSHPQPLILQRSHQGGGQLAARYQLSFGTGISDPFLLQGRCFLVEGPERVAAGLVFHQLLHTKLQQLRPGPHAKGPARILRGQFLPGLPCLGTVFEKLPYYSLVCNHRFMGIHSLVLFFQDIVLLKRPQGIFAVCTDKVNEASAQDILHAVMQVFMIGFQRLGMGLDKCEEVFRGAVLPLLHPQEGDNGLVKSLHVLLQLAPKGIPLLPVPALDGVDIQRSCVIEIYGKVLFYSFTAASLIFERAAASFWGRSALCAFSYSFQREVN